MAAAAFLSLLALFALAATSTAAEVVALDDRVDGSVLRYADLVRTAFPGLTLSDGVATGTLAAPLPHIDETEAPLPATTALSVSTVLTATIRSSGRPHLLVLADLGEGDGTGHAALMLFDEALRLLDLKDVGFDRITGFAGEPVPIGRGHDAFATASSHFNSNQTYVTTALMLVLDGKLTLIDTVATFGDRWCGHRAEQHLAFGSKREAGPGFWPLTATVTDIVAESEDDCEPIVPTSLRDVIVTYRWDAVRRAYAPNSDAFSELEASNAERF